MADTANRKQLRHRIEKQLKAQAEEQRRELMQKRIAIAKEGSDLYQKGRMLEAVRKYFQYFAILEYWKKCPRGNLSPDLFDRTKDIYEMILISGIFWDLCLLYDRARRKEQSTDLAGYLQKYILFSKGFPYEPLSVEALRRYISGGRCVNKDVFKEAYKTLSGNRCFVATSLVEFLPGETFFELRGFRDNVLKRSSWGAAVSGVLLSTRVFLGELAESKYASRLSKRIRPHSCNLSKVPSAVLNRFACQPINFGRILEGKEYFV